MIGTLMKFFKSSRHGSPKRRKNRPHGNHSMPHPLQQEVQAKAYAKRLRKMDRPHGWYNG